MGILRRPLRILWIGLLLLIVASAISALAASITVSPSRASSQSFALDVNDFKPDECAGITLLGFSWDSDVLRRDSALYFGTSGADTINSGNGSDCVLGDDGNDQLDGKGGNDVLLGEDGDDFLGGDRGDDILYGGPGEDTLQGNGGDDILYGEDGNDDLSGGNDNDFLYGGNGNDDLDGNNGTDTCYGGPGTNTFTRCEVCYNGAANTSITCP